jgi:hypothetical protein
MSKAKGVLLVALVLIVPACGNANISGSAPLLSETFSGSFPGTNWTAPVPTGATAPTVQISGGVLAFTAAVQPSSATTTSAMSFNNPSVTFSVQLGANVTAGATGIATIEILNGSNTVVAFYSWDVGGNSNIYSINTVADPTPPPAPAADGTLTTFQLNVNSSGIVTWSHNNVPVASGTTPLPAGPLKIRLGGSWSSGTTFAVFDFDNVVVTSP